MEPNRSLFIVYKTIESKVDIITKNVVKMLSRRIYIDNNGDGMPLIDYDSTIAELNDVGDYTYLIRTNNKKDYVLRIIFRKLQKTGKDSEINDFVKEYPLQHKILVSRDFKNVVADYAEKNNTELFLEEFFLLNIIENDNQPEFQVLTPKEKSMVMEEYNTNEYTTKKLNYKIDAIVKYYNLQVGDMVRIIRNSPTSAYNVDYRIVQ